VDLFGFFDFVRLWNLDPSAVETRRNLTSIGGGLRLSLPARALLSISYARPLVRALTNNNARPSDRLLLSLTMRLFPL